MKKMLKKMPMIFMLAMPYVVLAVLDIEDPTSFKSLFGASLVLFVVMSLINVAYAFILPKLGYGGKQLLFWDMVLKLCNIPVFAIIFFVCMLLNVLILPLIPVFVLFDFLLLLSSTMYGVNGLIRCLKEGKLSKKAFVINVIAHFVFCLDVISAVYCYVKLRDKKETPAVNTIPLLEPPLAPDPEAIEIFVNRGQDKVAELYYKNGVYTYRIKEKCKGDMEGTAFWGPGEDTESVFDTREKAIHEILSQIEPQLCQSPIEKEGCMTRICKDDYVFEVDIEKTIHYYQNRSLCECEFCKNYYAQIKGKFPELEAFLSEFGVDITRPDETFPVEENGTVDYISVDYTVCGKIKVMGQYELDIYDERFLSIVVTDGFVSPNGQKGEYFTLTVFNIELPWVLDTPLTEPKQGPKRKQLRKNEQKNR